VGNGMRALKALTVIMGVMILAGTAVLVAVIFHRATSPTATSPTATSPTVTSLTATGPTATGPTATGPGAPAALAGPIPAVVLDEPAGTHIAGMAATQDRIALQLQGGGTDRVVLVDPRTGNLTGSVRLAR
jgi:hypothetical protein